MQITRTTRWNWYDNIRANCIAPGLIVTDFARVLYETLLRAKREAAFPLGRLGQPDEIAGAAVMLASLAGSYITGQTIFVDGGATAAPASEATSPCRCSIQPIGGASTLTPVCQSSPTMRCKCSSAWTSKISGFSGEIAVA